MRSTFAHRLTLRWIIASTTLLGIAKETSLFGSPSTTTGLRLIFLNGIDISAARGQQLRKVDVQIAENGDIYISAPHYQVHEEDSYVPLSQYVQGINGPHHAKPEKAHSSDTSNPLPVPPSSPVVKAGEPLSPPADTQSLKGTIPQDSGPKEQDLEPDEAVDGEDKKEAPPSSPSNAPVPQEMKDKSGTPKKAPPPPSSTSASNPPAESTSSGLSSQEDPSAKSAKQAQNSANTAK